MIHNVLVKRKAVLDQLQKGLSILGLLDKIEKYPELFQENFVHQGDVTPEGVIGCLRFAETEETVKGGFTKCFLISLRAAMQMSWMHF